MKNELGLLEAKRLLKSLDYSKLSSLTIKNCQKLSITTAIKDRKDYLDISLATWIKFPFKEIVIVDWSSKDPYVPPFKDSRIKLIHVHDREYYEHSKARNFKIKHTESDIFLSIDCDIMLKPNFASSFFIRDNVTYITDDLTSSTIGSSIITKKVYEDLGKFNELLDEGWGYEDLDFYTKVLKSGHRHVCFPSENMHHIDHDDNLRVQNTKHKNKWLSNAANMKLAADNQKYVNPEFKGKYTIFYKGKKEEFNDE
jgi:hypothetical protein